MSHSKKCIICGDTRVNPRSFGLDTKKFFSDKDGRLQTEVLITGYRQGLEEKAHQGMLMALIYEMISWHLIEKQLEEPHATQLDFDLERPVKVGEIVRIRSEIKENVDKVLMGYSVVMVCCSAEVLAEDGEVIATANGRFRVMPCSVKKEKREEYPDRDDFSVSAEEIDCILEKAREE